MNTQTSEDKEVLIEEFVVRHYNIAEYTDDRSLITNLMKFASQTIDE